MWGKEKQRSERAFGLGRKRGIRSLRRRDDVTARRRPRRTLHWMCRKLWARNKTARGEAVSSFSGTLLKHGVEYGAGHICADAHGAAAVHDAAVFKQPERHGRTVGELKIEVRLGVLVVKDVAVFASRAPLLHGRGKQQRDEGLQALRVQLVAVSIVSSQSASRT